MPDYSQMAKWLLGNWEAPARAYNAQSPTADFGSGLLGNFLTKAHQAIDPVNGMGGYGGLLAMALPPGEASSMSPMDLVHGRYVKVPDPRGGDYFTVPKRQGLVAYKRRNSSDIESLHNPKLSELQSDEFATYARPKPGVQTELPASPNPDVIYRGMSAEEYANFEKTGKIQSNSAMNFRGQEGLTYFSNDPKSARFYSSGFAPMEYSATFDKPAYVVAVKRPPTSRIKNVRGTGSDEVAVIGHIPKNDVVGVYRGDTYNFDPGWVNAGSRTSPSASLAWTKIK